MQRPMQQPVRSSLQHDEVQPRPEVLLTFYISGRRSHAGLDVIGEPGLRPALFARYRDLCALVTATLGHLQSPALER